MTDPSDRQPPRRHRATGSDAQSSKRPRRFGALVGLVAIVFVATGIAIWTGGGLAGLGTALDTATPGATVSVTFSPPATASPSVGPAESNTAAVEIPATKIEIARLGIDLPIIEGDGIDVPMGKAAHYPGTAWPGGGSNIYLYAHAQDGMFIALWRAKRGDEITLRLLDNTERRYVVTKVLPKVAWNAIQYLNPTQTEQLTLQTCNSYQPTAPRFIVIAVPEM